MANKGLYYNINKRKKEGKAPLKPSSKNYPTDKAFEDSAKTAKEEYVAEKEGSMKTARKNVGADTCWTGYKAEGTKKKKGKTVPNCVKEKKSFEDFCSEATNRDLYRNERKINSLTKVEENVTIEDADGNTVAEIVDLIKPEPMTGWKQQVMGDIRPENQDYFQEVLNLKKQTWGMS